MKKFHIPSLTKEKICIICFSSGEISEKKYLENIFEEYDTIEYKYPQPNIEQLSSKINEDNVDKSIKKCVTESIEKSIGTQIEYFDLSDQKYLVIVATDCDKCNFDHLNILREKIKNSIDKFNNIDQYFILSYKGFESWIRFYYDDYDSKTHLNQVKKTSQKDIKDNSSTIFENHKKAVDKYLKETNYSEKTLDDYNKIDKSLGVYTDFPPFFLFMKTKYNLNII